jgi:hypothetical protein
MTTAGPTSGKRSENVEAMATARMQHAIAKMGSYEVGYIAVDN